LGCGYVTECVNAIRNRTIAECVGHPDDMKFHSSMTLFAAAADENEVFADAPTHFFGGRHDPANCRPAAGVRGKRDRLQKATQRRREVAVQTA
jgi:uncharacterized protein (DUF1810 family)